MATYYERLNAGTSTIDDFMEESQFTREVVISLCELKWKELREAEYPDFKDYLDGMVKGDQAQIQAYIDECLAVKAKYPKVSDLL